LERYKEEYFFFSHFSLVPEYLLFWVFSVFFYPSFFFLFSFTKRESIDGSYVQTVESSDQKKSIKRGGILLIGPIPIVFASSWRIALVFMIVAIIFMIIFWVLF